MKPAARAGRWRQLGLLAAAVLAVHLALLLGHWPTLAPLRDRPVQHFTARTVSAQVAPTSPTSTVPATANTLEAPAAQPAPAAAPAARVAAAPGGNASLRKPASSAPESAPAVALGRRPPVSPVKPGAAASAVPPAPAQAPSPAATPVPQPAPAPPATPFTPRHLAAPPSSVLHYDVSVRARGFTLSGRAQLDWRHDGQRYELRMEVSALGLRPRVQQSTGRITDEGLAPERFSDKARSEQATHFDRAGGRVIFSNNRPEAALEAGMQDRLSIVMQLAMLVAGDPARFAPGTQVVIPTASTREAEDWTFRVEGEESLDLPGGRVRALKLLRLPRKEFDQKVELWLAPGQDYAPVRLRLTNPDGGWVDQRWSSTDRP